jgi:hypothetical protein
MRRYFKINMWATFVLSFMCTFFASYKMVKDGMSKAQPYFIMSLLFFISAIIMLFLIIIRNKRKGNF